MMSMWCENLSNAWWFIDSECSCVGRGFLLRLFYHSFTCFAIHLLLQHLPPGYKHCQINLREQLISEYASWCGMTSTSKRTGSPSHTPILPYSGCNLAIPMTSNDIHPMKAANLKSNDYYEVLGVPRTANESEITKVASRFFDLRIMLYPVSSNIPTFAGEDI